MAQVEQLPGQLPLSMVAGDYFSMTLNFSGAVTDLTGYTFEAKVTDSSGGSTIDISVVSDPVNPLALVLSLPKEKTLLIPPKAKWHFTWVPPLPNNNPRTMLAGPVKAVAR